MYELLKYGMILYAVIILFLSMFKEVDWTNKK
jgi:hypothetical protein